MRPYLTQALAAASRVQPTVSALARGRPDPTRPSLALTRTFVAVFPAASLLGHAPGSVTRATRGRNCCQGAAVSASETFREATERRHFRADLLGEGARPGPAPRRRLRSFIHEEI
ncbi:hypothetical protein chiPu_0015164 [Chiloscyllium punctatum]|uniref:Uncharacterized protein n=1 Tax=Chiloscyllium punctatum TaxID=137246 RepID=A0A401T221_CHIPU|nr:hypothetical protein [Chiloscyllium punctatum]